MQCQKCTILHDAPEDADISLVDIPEDPHCRADRPPPRPRACGPGLPERARVDFTEAIRTLYPVAYKLKFLSKRELERDYVVPPLEGP